MLPRRRLFSSLFLVLLAFLGVGRGVGLLSLPPFDSTVLLRTIIAYTSVGSWKVQGPIPTGYDDASADADGGPSRCCS